MATTSSDYSPRVSVRLLENARLLRPGTLPDEVSLSDPAFTIFTDFRKVVPITIGVDSSLDEANEKMRKSGVRMLLVVNAAENVVGIITTTDLLGEKPIRIIEETRVDHDDIPVGDVMTPYENITALEMENLEDVRVGHIVATIHELERRHLLVVETASDGRHQIRGLFSASQISKKLGYDIVEDILPAHSLAEMVRQIG